MISSVHVDGFVSKCHERTSTYDQYHWFYWMVLLLCMLHPAQNVMSHKVQDLMGMHTYPLMHLVFLG